MDKTVILVITLILSINNLNAQNNKSFYLQNKKSGLYLDLPQNMYDNGVPLKLWDFNGKINQRWVIQEDVLGNIMIQSASSGKYLDVPFLSSLNKLPIIQWGYNDGTNQKWQLINNPDGTFSFLSTCSGLLLSAQKNKKNEFDVIQSKSSVFNIQSQKWYLIPVD
jgi:hypothetical protein